MKHKVKVTVLDKKLIYRYHYRQSTVSFSYILLILIRNKMIIEKAGQRTAAPPILYAYSIARISSTSD